MTKHLPPYTKAVLDSGDQSINYPALSLSLEEADGKKAGKAFWVVTTNRDRIEACWGRGCLF